MRLRALFFLLAAAVVPIGPQAANPSSPSDIRRDATVLAIESALPSVVNISTKTVRKQGGVFYDWWRDNWAPFLQELPPEYSAGSGVIIDEDGYVLTNVHVVEEADEITVKLADGRVLPAQAIAGTRRSDVALLKITGKPGEKFAPIRFAADDDLLLGETIMALGNPFGLGGSVSRGILSSKTRRTAPEEGALEIEDWLQTDAAINPGNSGGPLINLHGDLVGINVAIFKEGQGIGFAIPVKRINEALGDIFTPEEVRSLWFGAKLRRSGSGVVVAGVEPGSPADKSGLKKGDVVLKLNSRPVRSPFTFNRELIEVGDKQAAMLGIQRGNDRKDLSVKLVPETTFFNNTLLQKRLGLTVTEMTAEMAARSGLASAEGLIITSIEKGGPAELAGLRRGVILQMIDGVLAEDVTLAARLIQSHKPGSKTALTVIFGRPPRRANVEARVR